MMKRLLVLGIALAAATAASAASSGRNLVVSERSPALTLRIDPAFRELRPLRFPIEDLTNAERRIFVDAGRNRVIDRLVIVQFEKVRDGSDFRFLYPSTPPRRFGAATYRFGTFAYDDLRAAKANPDKEAGKTRAFLKAAGFKPARLYRVARLARVTDPKGLSEVIIFYMENADRRAPRGRPDADGDWSLPKAEQTALARRMESAVRAVRG
jgi:hypothetical protein